MKAFSAQAPAMHPEPAQPHRAEAPSHQGPKTSFWQLHSARCNSPWGANNSPNAPHLRKASEAVFSPGLPLSIGQSGDGLPLAPWALLLCWGFPVPESHSQRVLLRGEAGLGLRRHSAPRPQPCPLSQLGCSALRPLSTNGPKQAAWSCIQQGETPLREQSTATMCLLSGNQRKLFSNPALCSPGAKRGWATMGSLGSAALLGVSGA